MVQNAAVAYTQHKISTTQRNSRAYTTDIIVTVNTQHEWCQDGVLSRKKKCFTFVLWLKPQALWLWMWYLKKNIASLNLEKASAQKWKFVPSFSVLGHKCLFFTSCSFEVWREEGDKEERKKQDENLSVELNRAHWQKEIVAFNVTIWGGKLLISSVRRASCVRLELDFFISSEWYRYILGQLFLLKCLIICSIHIR